MTDSKRGRKSQANYRELVAKALRSDRFTFDEFPVLSQLPAIEQWAAAHGRELLPHGKALQVFLRHAIEDVSALMVMLMMMLMMMLMIWNWRELRSQFPRKFRPCRRFRELGQISGPSISLVELACLMGAVGDMMREGMRVLHSQAKETNGCQPHQTSLI